MFIFTKNMCLLLLAKSAFQIWIGIPIKRNERPTAFLELSEEFTWKAVGLSFLRNGIPIEKWKADRDNNIKNSLREFVPIHFSTWSRNEYNILLTSPKIQILAFLICTKFILKLISMGCKANIKFLLFM